MENDTRTIVTMSADLSFLIWLSSGIVTSSPCDYLTKKYLVTSMLLTAYHQQNFFVAAAYHAQVGDICPLTSALAAPFIVLKQARYSLESIMGRLLSPKSATGQLEQVGL